MSKHTTDREQRAKAEPLADSYVCADGTSYEVHSEIVRGEPRYYWVMCKRPGDRARLLIHGPDGSVDKRVVQRRARSCAAGHDAGVQQAVHEGPGGGRRV